MISDGSIKAKARPWLQFLDELQALGISDRQLPVPQIAVFGDQSSGKSSLLESISGIPFPKGTGLVTRCPTKISMSQSPEGEQYTASIKLPANVDQRKAAILGVEVHSPSELTELLNEAAKLVTAYNNNGFSSDCIHVSVRSPTTPDLSLIDLPGIIRTTTVGQNKSVINDVDQLLYSYMSQTETIILAVIPCNQDIATIDILERAHRYDPEGERTLGVLTKPDLIDRGAEDEVLAIIRNIRKPLKLGYIMVKNRSQADLRSSVSLTNALDNEEGYFTNHEIWSTLDRSLRGTKSLSDKLTNLIVTRAMQTGPYVKYQLMAKQKEIQAELPSFGSDIPSDNESRRKMLVKIITQFTQTLRQIAVGDYRDSLPRLDPDFRLKYTMYETLVSLEKDIKGTIPDLSGEDYKDKLKTAIDNLRGRELPGFGSTRLLLATVSEELDGWRTQIENTISQLFDVYTTVSYKLADKLCLQLPEVHHQITGTVHQNTSEHLNEMYDRIDELFIRSIESTSADQQLIESINTIRFERFDQVLEESLAVAKEGRPGDMSKEDLKFHVMEILGHAYMHLHAIGHGTHLNIEEARAVLTAYWAICEKRISEDIFSSVDTILLKHCSIQIEENLLEKMQSWLNDNSMLDQLFHEDVEIQKRRMQLTTLLKKITKALERLDSLIPNCVAKDPNTDEDNAAGSAEAAQSEQSISTAIQEAEF